MNLEMSVNPEHLPNILLAGRIHTGKSTLGREFEKGHGYTYINTGAYLLDILRAETGGDGPFSDTQIVALRKKLLEQRGPLYLLDGLSSRKPVVIDGVRSVEIACALKGAGFAFVHIGASMQDRLYAGLAKDQEHAAKEIISGEHAVLERDLRHQDALDAISNMATMSFVNDFDRPVHELATHILEVLTAGVPKEQAA